MNRLNPNKLEVTFGKGVNSKKPINGRKYTLTHSDITANLFLTIATSYDFAKITPLRDEVLAEWFYDENKYILYVFIHVGGAEGLASATLRDRIFRRELPLALEAIRYGDKKFVERYQFIDNAPIYIYFQSNFPQFNRVEYWGTLSDYK